MAISSTPARDDLFRPVIQGRISEVIVEQIRLLIRQGRLKPGDRLPAERDLCERFQVSRVTIREALRVLEAAGLIEIRVGARGGAFVTAPSSNHVGEGITDLLTMSSLSPAEVTEARMMIELGIIPLVCQRADEHDIADLRELCAQAQEALGDHDHELKLSLEFHMRLGRAAHNGAIELLLDSLREPLLSSLARSHEEAPVGQVAVQEHLAMVEAIAARDADKTTSIMTLHLRRTAARVGMPQMQQHLTARRS
jgi:GntR family transcriptional regulator, transcriptional repressor for pyruvate dehydrogenase complex